MKTASELLDEFLTAVIPPTGNAISLREAKSAAKDEPNWIAGIGAVPRDVLTRFESTVAELRRQHATVDWTGVVTMEGHWRRVAKYYSEREKAPRYVAGLCYMEGTEVVPLRRETSPPKMMRRPFARQRSGGSQF
jgi:hypothetical protein